MKNSLLRLLPIFFWILPLALVINSFENLKANESKKGIAPKFSPVATSQDKLPHSSKILYDADQFGFNQKMEKYVFRGDVVLVANGVLIGADNVEVNTKTRTLFAKGHVVLLANEIFIGDSLEYQMTTGDFSIINAIMVTNEAAEAKKVKYRILGFNEDEIKFEEAKKKFIEKIDSKKEAIKNKILLNGTYPSQEEIEKYALLLEQQDLITNQKPPHLEKNDKGAKKNFEKRRKFWQETQSQFKSKNILQKNTGYFHLSGRSISRTNGNDFRAEKAKWTPCLCDEDTEPAWSFEANKIFAQPGGYVTLSHPVLMIKGIPVLYLPFLRLPLKGQRQSGFLMPTLRTGNQKQGTVYTQPVFFALSDSFDTTVTADFFQRKGTRLGLELRYQQRKYSGWEINYELMRDQEWLRQLEVRKAILPAAIAECNDLDSDEEQQSCRAQAQRILSVPTNSWRGSQSWRGLTFLFPRLSIVGRGHHLSDHRYSDDLDIPRDLKEVLLNTDNPRRFATSKAFVHYDQTDFYSGLGLKYGDNLFSIDKFKGYQIPAHIKVKSRYFEIIPSSFPFSIYGNLTGEHIHIKDQDGKHDVDDPEIFLGNGQWTRIRLDQIAPFSSDGIFTMHQFSSFELRKMIHTALKPSQSSIRSWRTGVSISLPIDGIGSFPQWAQDTNNPNQSKKYIHHEMDWNLTFSARPSVIRRGVYGETNDQLGAPLVYFGSDRKVHTEDNPVEREEVMIPNQIVELSTSHQWTTFDRTWNQLPFHTKESRSEKKNDYKAQAKQHLNRLFDSPITDPSAIYHDKDQKWLTPRYRHSDTNHQRSIWYEGSISYDFSVAKERQHLLTQNASDQKLRSFEPWQGPNMKLGFILGEYLFHLNGDYNTYSKIAESLNLSLTLPTYFDLIDASFNHDIGRNPIYDDKTGTQSFNLTKTTATSINWSLFSSLTLQTYFARKKIEGDPKNYYQSKAGFTYTDNSKCWGLSFLRHKDFTQEEQNASYFMQLSITFLGQTRPIDFSPALEKKMGTE